MRASLPVSLDVDGSSGRDVSLGRSRSVHGYGSASLAIFVGDDERDADDRCVPLYGPSRTMWVAAPHVAGAGPIGDNRSMKAKLLTSAAAALAGLFLGWHVLTVAGFLFAFGLSSVWVSRSYAESVRAGRRVPAWLSALEELRRNLAIED